MKKIVILSVITLLVFMSSITVSAKSCTGYKGAPYFYEVAPDRKGDTYPLQTAANQCLGSNTAVYFTNFRSFPDSYKYPDATFYVTLYEEDPPGNEDERIKRYFFIVRNKVVDEVRLDGTYTMGAMTVLVIKLVSYIYFLKVLQVLVVTDQLIRVFLIIIFV